MSDVRGTDDADAELLGDGGTWLLDLVAAVDHLRRGLRPNFTVWDALEEALRWHSADDSDSEPAWGDHDPLHRTLRKFVEGPRARSSAEAQEAIRRWALAMADRYNDGHHWPHPSPRRAFPPPAISAQGA